MRPHQSTHGLSRLAVAAWEGGLRFDPSGAARDANLNGVELRVDRTSAYSTGSNSTVLSGATTAPRATVEAVTSLRTSDDNSGIRTGTTSGIDTAAPRSTSGSARTSHQETTAAASMPLGLSVSTVP